jgi:outer membrane protein
MKKTLLIPAILLATFAVAQDSTKWNLRTCVDYAMKNNISVKQATVQARISALQAKQAKMFQYPTANFNTGLGLQFGRSVDPTTNQFTTSELLYQNYSLQGGAQIYNWGRIKNSIAASTFSAQAAIADAEKAANDVALNVCVYYLQTLATKEQIRINEVQLARTMARLGDTKKRVEAGSLPELNVAELESQLAVDSTNFIASKISFEQNLLSLKGLLNIDAAAKFEIETPSIDKIPIEPLADLMPDIVFQLAIANQPQQKSDSFRIKAAEKNVLASKAQLYPTISGNYSLSSTYNNKAQQIIGTSTFTAPIGTVKVGGTDYNVFPNTPFTSYSLGKTPYGTQLNQNFQQAVGVNVSVPIFNNGQRRIGYEQSKLNLKSAQLQSEQSNQKLKLDIYTAYTNAVNAMQKFYGTTKQVEASQKAYDYSIKRYEIGLLGTLDLIINQNNLATAKIQQLSSQFDYVFRMKLLEFYKGQGLKL